MPKRKKDAALDQRRLAKNRKDRASYYRTRLAEGKTLTEEQARFLAEYDGKPHGNSQAAADERDAAVAAAGESPEPAAPEADDDDDDDAEDGPTPVADVITTTKAPPPPEAAPPFVAAAPLPGAPRTADPPVPIRKEKEKAHRWQDDVALPANMPGGNPRFATCFWIAKYWHGALKQMTDAMKEADIDPIFNVDDMAGIFILAVDEILPPHVTLTPKLMAAATTSGIVTQRFVRSKAIESARAKKEIAERGRAVGSVAQVIKLTPKEQPKDDPLPSGNPHHDYGDQLARGSSNLAPSSSSGVRKPDDPAPEVVRKEVAKKIEQEAKPAATSGHVFDPNGVL